MTNGAETGPSVGDLSTGQRQRRDRILVAALEALNDNAFDQIQIKEVAESAGVALGTVYRYFVSKERLYAFALFEWATTGPEMVAAREVPADLGPEDRVRARIRGILSGFEQRPRYYRLHVLLRSSSDTVASTLITQTEIMTRTVIAEDLEGLGSMRAEDVALMLWAIADASLLEAINRGHGMADAYRVIDRFIDLLATPLRWHRD